jgi:uroporphyrinogen decarboxylase
MQPIKNDRFLKAIYRQPVDQTPIWIMRQAGRYLPEYRKVRAEAGSFMTLCKTPELATEVTLQPLRRFPLDAAILFSDILTIPDAHGLGLHFVEGEGPQFERVIRSQHDLASMGQLDLGKLEYVYDAIKLIHHELNGSVPLIGFVGSPYTVAAYMIEGRSKNGFPTIVAMREQAPALLHSILDTLRQSITAHINAQIKAGVSAIMIFDTWGGMLDTENYQIFSLSYIKSIISNTLRAYNNKSIPVILFTKGGGRWLPLMVETGCDMLGVDWEITLQEARAQVGGRVALQGNLNPSVLLSQEAVIRDEVARTLASYGHGSGHVFNLGHGITPDVPPEHVAVLVNAVHEMSRAYHKDVQT